MKLSPRIAPYAALLSVLGALAGCSSSDLGKTVSNEERIKSESSAAAQIKQNQQMPEQARTAAVGGLENGKRMGQMGYR